MNLLGAFSGGLWIIPLIGIIGTVVFGIKAWKSSHSGSQQQTPAGTVYSDKNVPAWGYIVFTGICLIGTIVAIFVMINDK